MYENAWRGEERNAGLSVSSAQPINSFVHVRGKTSEKRRYSALLITKDYVVYRTFYRSLFWPASDKLECAVQNIRVSWPTGWFVGETVPGLRVKMSITNEDIVR